MTAFDQKYTRLFVFLVLVAASGLSAHAVAAELRGKVTEVKGEYCKIELVAADGARQGGQARLHRAGAGEGAIGQVVITAVTEGYSVGKVTGSVPQVGDVVVIPATEATVPVEPRPDDAVLDGVVGSQLDVKLRSGTDLNGVKLLSVDRDSKTGQAKTIRVNAEDKPRPLSVSVASIERIEHDGKLILDLDVGSSGRPKSAKRLMADARAKKEAEDHEKWLARLQTRGVEPWPELTDEEHNQAIAEHKDLARKIGEAFPGMALHETKQFLFYTNMPPQQVGPYVVSLDAMHEMMCQMYRIKKGTRVWRGKALVVAFMHQEEFMRFEQMFMETNVPPGVYGICHQDSNGDVVIGCFRGDRVEEFGQMLVHETSHGFIHRYKTPVRFPSWVNEGMADWIGLAMVPACQSVKLAEAMAIERLKETRMVGGQFFTRSHIDSWQYGLASNLADFMVRNNKKAYVDFIEGMKEGMTWQESLAQSYRCTPEQLVTAYGRAIGVPDLRP